MAQQTSEAIFERAFAAGWNARDMQLQRQQSGSQRSAQGGNLAYGGGLPGMGTTQTRRRGPGRPRKATTGATTTSGRSHKRKST
jgi:hypothetical protein